MIKIIARSEFLAPKKPTANNTLKKTKCKEIFHKLFKFENFVVNFYFLSSYYLFYNVMLCSETITINLQLK